MSHLCIKPACGPTCDMCNWALSPEQVIEYAKRYAWLRERYSSLMCGAHGMSPYVTFQKALEQPTFYPPPMLDTAIDAALKDHP